jgi:hypothetical protein
VLMKGMLKMVKNFVSPEQIKEAASSLIRSAIDFKKTVQLDPETGETTVTAIFYEINAQVYFAIAIMDDTDHILRFENVQPLDTMIDNLIKKI